MTVGIWIIAAVVVGAVALVERRLYRRARYLAELEQRVEVVALERRLAADIEHRAKIGLPPDWLRYRAELERLFEGAGEELRSIASAALAAGLGGTILALFLHTLYNLWHGTAGARDFSQLILGIGIALVGSLIGIVVNLWIILRLLPFAEERLARTSEELFERLEAASAQQPPSTAVAQTVRDELALLRQTLTGEFTQAFSTAILGFPDVIARLDITVATLANTVNAQAGASSAAAVALGESAGTVSEGTRQLRPLVETLTQGVAQLATLPAQIGDQLESYNRKSVEDLERRQAKHLSELIELQRRTEEVVKHREGTLQGVLAEIHQATSALPEALVTAVHQMAEKLGNSFGFQAQQLVADLHKTVTEERSGFLERIDSYEKFLLNRLGTAAEALFDAARKPLDEVVGSIREGLVGRVEAAGVAIEGAADRLVGGVGKLEESERSWVTAQAMAQESWSRAGERVLTATVALGSVDEQLQGAVSALAKSSDHLERAADTHDTFRRAIEAALREAMRDHLTRLDGVLTGITESMSRYEAALDGQIAFIRKLAQEVVSSDGAGAARRG